MKKKILYIHGFMSGANGMTITNLRRRYEKKYDFIVPELDADPSVSIPKINEIIKTEQPSLIIGNSLGGFFALMCESGNIPILAVNPCVNPYEHMKRYVDQTLEYHSKRNDGSTTYLFTQETLEKFKEYNYIKDKIKANMDNIWALLSTRDEVLGDTHIKLFEEVKKETGYKYVLSFKNGFFGHRFTYSNIIVLREFIDEIMSERN